MYGSFLWTLCRIADNCNACQPNIREYISVRPPLYNRRQNFVINVKIFLTMTTGSVWGKSSKSHH